ncbi:hypothetical protein ACHWQZ_G017661 [Mnemiopsis leidyi]
MLFNRMPPAFKRMRSACGVCIGIHKSPQNGVASVPVDTTEDIVAVKLKAKFFDLDQDTFLINTYDFPANGSFKKRKQAPEEDNHVTTLEHLQELDNPHQQRRHPIWGLQCQNGDPG